MGWSSILTSFAPMSKAVLFHPAANVFPVVVMRVGGKLIVGRQSILHYWLLTETSPAWSPRRFDYDMKARYSSQSMEKYSLAERTNSLLNATDRPATPI